ncbi:MAG: hypothetical protein AWU57_1195, partial [Marinobacter sp. T13-3]
ERDTVCRTEVAVVIVHGNTILD